MIEKPITIEGILREEENERNGVAWHGLVAIVSKSLGVEI